MIEEAAGAVRLFYVYARRDEVLREDLDLHLSALRRQNLITSWANYVINAGEEWGKDIGRYLETADVILLLISSDFLSSDFCYGAEMQRMIHRHEVGETRIIPIILRPTDWSNAPFDKFQPLPTNGKPVTTWPSRDDAFVDIIKGIRRVIRELIEFSPIRSSRLNLNTRPGSSIGKSATPQIWNIPHARNHFFTGREDVLQKLRENLTDIKKRMQTQVISGLGGVGKTQIAVEYAYRYRDDYRYVFWARGSNYECLLADFVSIADLLRLPERDEQDQDTTIRIVRRWLENHTDWLLICDGVDDMTIVNSFLPGKASNNGHMLLTTRSSYSSDAIVIDNMKLEEGVLLLLRRARVLPPNVALEFAPASDRSNAEEIVRIVDGLPLALDQAGAYIEETSLSLSEYLDLYKRNQDFLRLRRYGNIPTSYPEAVDTTWTISFRAVGRENSAAADLLCFCAFLAPDAIPEELLIDAADEVGALLGSVVADEFLFNAAIETLRRYSLIRRDTETKTLSIHRLVQAVLKKGMSNEIQRTWAERAVKAINKVIPIIDHEFPQEGADSIVQFQRYLSQALACIELIEQYNLKFPEAAQLLDHVGDYLQIQGQYQDAEQLLRRALLLWEQVSGPNNAATIQILYNLAALYQKREAYEEAERLLQQALAIVEDAAGIDHPATARILSNLAALYKDEGRYEEAEPLFKRALSIFEQAAGTLYPGLITILNGLADLYREQNRNGEAEPLFQRALFICEQELGLNRPEAIVILNNLGILYLDWDRYEDAELFFERAVNICEQLFGPMHVETASSLHYLAQSYLFQSKYKKAEPLLQRALRIREKMLGSDHADTVSSLYCMALLYYITGKYADAEWFFKRVLTFSEHAQGLNIAYTINTLHFLALLYYVEGEYVSAEALFRRLLSISEQRPGSNKQDLAAILNSLAIIDRIQRRYEEAEALFLRVLAIREQEGGGQDLDTAQSLNHLAVLYYIQGRFGHAKSLYERAMKIYEHVIHQGSLEQAYKDWFEKNGALNTSYFETVFGLNELGLLLQEAGEIEQAHIFFGLLLEILGLNSGEEHAENSESQMVTQEVQQWLLSIIQELTIVRTSSSRLKRATALMQTVSLLSEAPQQFEALLPAKRLVIRHTTDSWNKIVRYESGRVRTPEILEEVYSPYIFTTPTRTVSGRKDLFQRITSLWARKGQRNSLLIYGQHRMGKTSLVQAIMQHCDLGSDTELIYFSAEAINLEHEGYLYYEIAYRIWLLVEEKMEEPRLRYYIDSDARTAFNQFLAHFNKIIGTIRLVLIIDEFELLYKYLGQEKATKTIAYLRVQTQTYHWFALGIVGLSDLKDLKRSYNSQLRGWEEMKVSFLAKELVAEILLNPPHSPDFPLDYTERALELIATLTSGQPFLVQVIGDMLVQRYNYIVFILHREHRGIFDIADVQAVVKDVSFYNRAAAYFEGVWSQVIKGSPGEKEILLALAKHEDGLEEDALRDMVALTSTVFAEALNELKRHDILYFINDRLYYRVPLMQRWIQDIYQGADADFADEINGR